MPPHTSFQEGLEGDYGRDRGRRCRLLCHLKRSIPDKKAKKKGGLGWIRGMSEHEQDMSLLAL